MDVPTWLSSKLKVPAFFISVFVLELGSSNARCEPPMNVKPRLHASASKKTSALSRADDSCFRGPRILPRSCCQTENLRSSHVPKASDDQGPVLYGIVASSREFARSELTGDDQDSFESSDATARQVRSLSVGLSGMPCSHAPI
jgi:hypothetical protein